MGIAPAAANSAVSRRSLAPRVAVVQDGARLHYALPLALKRAGMLEKVFTEFFVTRCSLEAAIARTVCVTNPAVGRRMVERRCAELASSTVRRNLWLAWRQVRSRKRFANEQEFFRWSSEMVGQWVQREGLGNASALMGFVLNIDPG